ncbi:PAAR domain-containing protein [Pseudomonas wayambapalatensis]|uniref:PAAR domain-containing protein n=1 Tax=Pseudomonas wayambapalatensis TaxID=485895 RepID=UPI003CF4DADF
MSRRGAIRMDDVHAGGGRMIEASGMLINGRAQCVLGDRAECPLHNGVFALVSGGEDSIKSNGRPLMFEPAKLDCGCQVRSSCSAGYAKR